MKTKLIIDAVTVRVNALALPAHRTLRYTRPLSIAGPTGQMVPFLAISPAKTKPALLTTDNLYERVDKLLITWFAAAMSTSGPGIADEGAAAACLAQVALIAEEIASWPGGAVPGLAFQSEAALGDIDYGHIEGGVWAAEIGLDVRTWEA